MSLMFHPVSGRWHSCTFPHLSLTKQCIVFIDIHQTGGKHKITLQQQELSAALTYPQRQTRVPVKNVFKSFTVGLCYVMVKGKAAVTTGFRGLFYQ
jgi:hypothetical protein